MDMIAYQKTANGKNQVLLETTSKWATTLFPYYRESASRYTTLGVFESTTAWGSDHGMWERRRGGEEEGGVGGISEMVLLTFSYTCNILFYFFFSFLLQRATSTVACLDCSQLTKVLFHSVSSAFPHSPPSVPLSFSSSLPPLPPLILPLTLHQIGTCTPATTRPPTRPTS